MERLNSEQIQSIFNLLHEGNDHFPLMKTKLIEPVLYEVYVDQAKCPKSAFILGENGWCYQIGNENDDSFNNEVLRRIETYVSDFGNPVLWFGTPKTQKMKLQQSIEIKVTEYPRYQFAFNRSKFTSCIEDDFEYEVELVNDQNLKRFMSYYPEFSSFWPRSEDFISSGLALVAIHNGEMIAHAGSASAVDGEMEIDLFTKPAYRGKGISGHLVNAFIKLCLEAGNTPKWDCYIGNQASIKLAHNMGFEIKKKYSFCYIESM